ncbi:MAG: hypothetical protein NTX50_24435 [Candidatus Sumerlaeota bacterium]|nr:hypothetical protein [Candidatus Sumerlaeota bacterium]
MHTSELTQRNQVHRNLVSWGYAALGVFFAPIAACVIWLMTLEDPQESFGTNLLDSLVFYLPVAMAASMILNLWVLFVPPKGFFFYLLRGQIIPLIFYIYITLKDLSAMQRVSLEITYCALVLIIAINICVTLHYLYTRHRNSHDAAHKPEVA